MAAAMDPVKIGDAIMAFALNGRFPEEADALPPVSATDLQPAIESLERAGDELEVGACLCIPFDVIADGRN